MQHPQDGHRQERRNTRLDLTLWAECAPCAYAAVGGQPCYYHHSRFGVGKLTTIAKDILNDFLDSAEDELKEWIGE